LGGVSPAVSHSEPAAAAKDFSKTAIVILGYGLTGPTVAQFFPASRIILEDKASSTVQNRRFSVPLTKEAGTSGAGELPRREPVGECCPVRARRDQSVRQRWVGNLRARSDGAAAAECS
jgi:hypothetical protein